MSPLYIIAVATDPCRAAICPLLGGAVDDLISVQHASAELSARISKGLEIRRLRGHAPTSETRIGDRIASYRLLEHLGSGGVASVFRAEHVETREAYAVKLLRGDLNKHMVERFGRESVALSRLQHASVVTVVDFGVTRDGIPYLAMEHVHGDTLAELIKREGRIAPRRVSAIARQLAEGLDEAHCLGFIHRDVKPSNVIVSRDPDGCERVKLLDFGVVGLAEASMSKQLTTVGMIVGTPKYMSPEQAAGESQTFASDLYALGLVMYEMLAGRPAFKAPSVAKLLLKQISEMPVPLSPCGGLDGLVMKLLRKAPEERLESAEALVRALDRLEGGLSDAPICGAMPPIELPIEDPAADRLQTVDLPDPERTLSPA